MERLGPPDLEWAVRVLRFRNADHRRDGRLPVGKGCLQFITDRTGWKGSEINFILPVSCCGLRVLPRYGCCSLCACGQNEANHGFNDVLFCVDIVCTAHTHGTQHDLRSFLLRKSRLGKSSVYTSMQWMQWQGRVAYVLHSCAFVLRSLFPNVSPGNLRTS